MEALHPSRDRDEETITAVDMTCDILHTVYRQGNPTLADLDEALEYSKSSIHAHVETLIENFMVIRHYSGNPTDLDFDGAQPRFSLSLRFWVMGRSCRQHVAPSDVIRPAVVSLARRTGALAQFVVPEYGLAIAVEQAAGHDAIDLDVEIGDVWPMYPSAYGMAILSQYAEDDLRSEDVAITQARTAPAFADVDRDRFLEDLATIADRGYAVDEGDTIRGASVIAAPVVARGRIVGAVGVCGPESRFADDRTAARMSQAVIDAGDAITAAFATAE